MLKELKLSKLSEAMLKDKEMSSILGGESTFSYCYEGQARLRLPIYVSKKYIVPMVALTLSMMTFANYPVIPRPINRSLGKATVIDSSYVQVFYAFNADNIQKMDSYEDFQCLEIGKNNARYFSAFLEKGEQKVNNWLQEHKGAQSVPNVNTDGKRGLDWSEYQYTELYIQKDKLTGYYSFPMYLSKYNASCVEEFPLQKWEMGEETKTICNHRCQKAVCHFRGRNFTAWFTTDIPLKYGPWKFGGLPGLILRLSDSTGEYTFECVKIERKKKPLLRHAFNKYTPKKRIDIVKLQRLINENFFSVVGANGGNLPIVTNASYKPLELE